MKKFAAHLLLALLTTPLISLADADYYWLQEREPDIVKIENGLYKVTFYHSNGKVQETGYYKNGATHGKWVSYNQNGQKTASVTFNNGKCTGKMRMWDKNGDVISIVDYENKEIQDYRMNENTIVLH